MKEGPGRTIAASFLVLMLFVALGGGAWYGFGAVSGFLSAADFPGPGRGEAVVAVESGDSATAIADTLYGEGVVKSAAAFVAAAKDNPDSKDIQVGSYLLKKEMKASDALTMLLDLKNLNVHRVTLPEGLTYLQVYDRLAKATGIPVGDFKKAGKDPAGLGVPALWFKRDDGKKIDRTNIEGFLYPATYEIAKGATATDVLKQIVKNFNTEMAETGFPDTVRAKLDISPYEALVAASIAQVEALLDKDMGPVARVLYNRAYTGNFPCECLQLDSTVNYWLRLTGKEAKSSEKLLVTELHDPKNPYNYDVKGMAIGPISNPGDVALRGAMNPKKSDNYFFVTVDDKGAMAYGKTFADHEKNIEKACENGIPIC
ncbi:endolytic transglycosylase MltG [Actinoplanes sp. DH11]|uniref:endolytic transglycosylase MltG n=1 Tax=Actinoplanes sp. DH11 TaxID=2857011 RepID=UPI001E4F0ADE|nr:endolytic transglycosylase MltG [Actinoplanes sp. DH11]